MAAKYSSIHILHFISNSQCVTHTANIFPVLNSLLKWLIQISIRSELANVRWLARTSALEEAACGTAGKTSRSRRQVAPPWWGRSCGSRAPGREAGAWLLARWWAWCHRSWLTWQVLATHSADTPECKSWCHRWGGWVGRWCTCPTCRTRQGGCAAAGCWAEIWTPSERQFPQRLRGRQWRLRKIHYNINTSMWRHFKDDKKIMFPRWSRLSDWCSDVEEKGKDVFFCKDQRLSLLFGEGHYKMLKLLLKCLRQGDFEEAEFFAYIFCALLCTVQLNV